MPRLPSSSSSDESNPNSQEDNSTHSDPPDQSVQDDPPYQPTYHLKRGSMRIIDFAAKVPGRPMNIKMEFTLKDGTKKIVDMEHTTEAFKGSRKFCINQTGQYLYLDNVKDDKQDLYFGFFIDQHLKLYDELHNPADDTHNKRVIEVQKPSLQVIDEKYYWVSSSQDIFLLNSGEQLATKLSQEEMEELSVEIVYVGPRSREFLTDEKRALEIITSMIQKVNLMQTSKIYSFPLASFCANLSAFLYKILVEKYRYFSTSIVLSGSGNTNRTGKSLLTSFNQLAFYGEWPQKRSMKITEASLYDVLDKGETFYLKEWNHHEATLNTLVPSIWERLGRETKTGYKSINAAVLIEANLSPEDIKFTTANESKCIFIATGSTPLEHEHMMALCDEVEKLGKELFSYLPVLCAIGLLTMLDKITDDQLAVYDGLLRVDRDPRDGQAYLNYDRVHKLLADAIDKYGFETPLLFQAPTIDRTALTTYNGREAKLTVEEMATLVGEYLVDNATEGSVEYTERTNNFKIRLANTALPENLQKALRGCTKATTSAFDGKKSKLRLLSATLLSNQLVAKLRALGQSFKFSDWVTKMLEEKEVRRRNLGVEFYKEISRTEALAEEAVLTAPEDLIDYQPQRGGTRSNLTTPQSSRQSSPVVPEPKCTEKHCPSYNHTFKNQASYKRHLLTKGHDIAVKMGRKGRK